MKTLVDGTQVFSLANFLFDHKGRVNEALQKMNSQPRRFGPLGEPLGKRELCAVHSYELWVE